MTSERIIQNAYYVPDIDEGIARFHALRVWGPFLCAATFSSRTLRTAGHPQSSIFLRPTPSPAT